MAQGWAGTYAVSGSAQARSGGRPVAYVLPETMRSSIQGLRDKGFLFEVFGENEQHEVLGLKLYLNDEAGDRMYRIAVVSPVAGEGTATAAFPLNEPVRWLSLPAGTADRATVFRGGSHELTVTRGSADEWQVAVESLPGGTPLDWVSRASLRFGVDAPRPPWGRIELDLEMERRDATASGSLVLTRLR